VRKIDPRDVLKHDKVVKYWVEIPLHTALIHFEFEPVVVVYTIQGRRYTERVSGASFLSHFRSYLHDNGTRFYKLRKFDLRASLRYMKSLPKDPLPKGQGGHCAHYVNLGLEAGHLDTSGRPIQDGESWARWYGPFLLELGFRRVLEDGYAENQALWREGDIAVLQPVMGPNRSLLTSKEGHIEMWDGEQWTSEWRQRRFLPWSQIPDTKGVDYAVYRFH
jgi:hypothetical protein